MPTAPQNTDELYDALQENQRRPYGRARTVAAEELAEAAERFEDPLALVRTLFELQEAYTYGSEPRKSPVVFARLLTLFDEQPDVFTDRLRHLLFWRFKWVANSLRALPEIPLTSLRQWLTEMRGRYEKAGLGLQPYYAQTYQLAAHLGEDTAPAYELWAARTRTPFSDCEACEICERALHHLEGGDDARALRTWEPVLDGKESCQEEPARSLSYALLPLLRTGGADRARELHLAGYRGCRRNPSMAGEVGRHLEFCALTGNEARGLELLAENRVLFSEVDSPLDQFDFLTGVEVLLRRVESLGHGELPAAGYPGRTWTVTGLCAEVRERADDLAARFDARNGTTAHADRRKARLDRAPLLDALELTLRTRALDDLAPAATPAAAPPAHQAPAVPDTVPELIARARELDEQGHPEAQPCWDRLRTLVDAPDYNHPEDPAVGPLVRLRADLLSDEAAGAAHRDDDAQAAALYAEAAALYEAAELPGDAAVVHAAAALARSEADGEAADAEEKAEGLTAGHAHVVRLHEETPGLTPCQEGRLLRMRASALCLRAQLTRSEEHLAAAAAEVEQLHTYATRHELAVQISGAVLLRAGTHALSGDLPTALTVLDAHADRLRQHGPAWHLPRTLGLRGRFRMGLRDAQAAYAELSEAVRAAAEWPARVSDTATLHGDLAEVCMHLGRPEEALRHLTRSAELDLRQGKRTDAFCTYSNAAQLSLDLGRVEDSIALLDSVLAEPDIAAGELDDRLTAQLRLNRARALHAGEDLKAATTEFVALAAESADWDDDPGSHAMIAAETAVLLGEAGDFDRAAEAIGQALAAHDRAPRYEQLSNALRELARLQAEQQGADGLPDALARLADADRVADEARAAGYEPHGRSLETALAYEHGRVHAYAGQYEDSLTALEKALGGLGEPGPENAGEWAECTRLAGVVEGIYLERTAAALTRLDTAIPRLAALGHTEETEALTALATRLRDEE
ncbi:MULTISPECIES: tetratricopeptide repeat protein [unclassified Streptomyces]|uniref:tetratricopeptide repeat protein n=1 Tax=unclassified Streptomyces TaxID=2593676 RepID=UPI00037C1806|nr:MULTISPECIES: tetratricopeptide repeat protein [unclassified Streptomyces]MYQ78770.1 tetratricopeptide repeat protein [Streptomyces sp. SID4923]